VSRSEALYCDAGIVAHFPIEAWADYARGAVTPDERSRLDEHLSDCPRCARLVARLRDFKPTITADAGAYAVPDAVVHRAESLAAPPPVRRLSFTTGGVRIGVDVTPANAPGRRNLTGQVTDAVSAAPIRSRVFAHEQASGVTLVSGDTDERGGFQLECPARVPIRLRIVTVETALSLDVVLDPLA
jgi:anti-sigma factor RsiW